MHFIKNILNKNEAKALISSYNNSGKVFIKQCNDSIIHDYIKKIKPYAKYPIKQDSNHSYFEVQSRQQGHKIHYDTGSSQHMMWCGFSSSCLLSDPSLFKGGMVTFTDSGGKNQYDLTPKEHYLTGIAYRSVESEGKNKHLVEPHTGNRTVLLMFIELEENGK